MNQSKDFPCARISFFSALRFFIRYCCARGNNQVALTCNASWLSSSMSIALSKSFNGSSRHHKSSKNPILYNGNIFSFASFIIMSVVSIQIDAVPLRKRRVVGYRKKRRKKFFAYFSCKSLAFLLILLTMTFDSMPQNLVKKYSSRTTSPC